MAHMILDHLKTGIADSNSAEAWMYVCVVYGLVMGQHPPPPHVMSSTKYLTIHNFKNKSELTRARRPNLWNLKTIMLLLWLLLLYIEQQWNLTGPENICVPKMFPFNTDNYSCTKILHTLHTYLWLIPKAETHITFKHWTVTQQYAFLIFVISSVLLQ